MKMEMVGFEDRLTPTYKGNIIISYPESLGIFSCHWKKSGRVSKLLKKRYLLSFLR